MQWILAIIGYLFFKLPGAVMGFILGLFLKNSQINIGGSTFRPTFQNHQNQSASPADFEVNLLSLCSLVIKANGQVSQAELDFVRIRFVEMYGKERANAVFRTFNELVKGREISAFRVSTYLKTRTPYETRLQIIHFLFGIAKADGIVSDSEVQQIHEIARYFQISYSDFESIKAMFVHNQTESIRDAYTILEINRNASNAEVKKAYREMAKKYHPDRVITQDEAIKKGAEEKFKQVQKAYEQILKERGI
ncbi:TerB family tellurite resistance protein [Capnocytophaga stomatis]|uniref:tellurite resistance TerB family protein n=1 Tax=Capnocytophaga stomatis TaxID=1848904 RepID=UPI003858C1EE